MTVEYISIQNHRNRSTSRGKRFLEFMLIRCKFTNRYRFPIQFNDLWFNFKKILILVLIIILIYKLVFVRRIDRREKFITFKLNHNKFSDQLFEFCTGTILAKMIGGRFYLINEQQSTKVAQQHLYTMAKLFPLLQPYMMYIVNPTSQIFIPYDLTIKKNLKRYTENQSQILVFDSKYAFDTTLLQQYESDIRRLLEFSEDFQDTGSQILQKYNVTTHYQSAMCVHVKDKLQLKGDDNDIDMHDIVVAARTIAIKLHLTDFYIFTDDTSFSYAMEQILMAYNIWQPNVHVHHFTQAMDLYVVRQVCKAVLLTSIQSTHGFWIGFFAMPNIVYYLKPKRLKQEHLYLPSWVPYVQDELVQNVSYKS